MAQRPTTDYPTEQRALIIVDVQNDFCEGGSMGVTGGNDTAAAIAQHVRDHAQDYAVIVTTQDWHIDPGHHWAPEGTEPDFSDSWPVHCAADSTGALLHPALVEALVTNPLTTGGRWQLFLKGEYEAAYSGFEAYRNGKYAPEFLGDYLRSGGIEALDVCGIATDYCVRATVLDGLAQGFRVEVTPMVAAVTEDTGEAARREMLAAGATVTYRGL